MKGKALETEATILFKKTCPNYVDNLVFFFSLFFSFQEKEGEIKKVLYFKAPENHYFDCIENSVTQY
jgi:hypothetical protein